MIYLDHAASAPLRPAAREAWQAAADLVGNASSVHGAGQRARRVLEDAREQIAAALGCDPIEVVLTSGGTEAVNLAIKGLWWSRGGNDQEIVLPDGEHHAVLESVGWLATHEGAGVRAVALDGLGHIDGGVFRDALGGSAERPRAALATALVANNEIGTLQDAPALAAAAAEAGVPLHLDAIGAVGHVDVDFAAWRGPQRGHGGLAAMSVSGHKLGAPVGTGALVVSRHAQLTALIHGGGQQRALRSGSTDIAGAAALAAAVTEAVAERESEDARLGALRARLLTAVTAQLPEVELLGDPRDRLPGNIHLLFPGAAGETLLFLLDQAGIAVSTGSACQAGVTAPSHVVLALGRSAEDARSVLRFSLGPTTTAADVDAVAAALPAAYARARSAR